MRAAVLRTQDAEESTWLDSAKERESPDELGRKAIILGDLPEWRDGEMAHGSGQMSLMRML